MTKLSTTVVTPGAQLVPEVYYPKHPVDKPVNPETLNSHQRLAFDAIRDLNTANSITASRLTGSYTVAKLPAGVEGQIAFATNGRKSGEGAGAGTGVRVYFSNGVWRTFSTDAQVLA